MMTQDERMLLTETAKHVVQLFNDRNDMVVGITSVLLDLYRTTFQINLQTKQEALTRLVMQRNALAPQKPGYLFLSSLIDCLRDDRLDDAKLLREPPAGHA